MAAICELQSIAAFRRRNSAAFARATTAAQRVNPGACTAPPQRVCTGFRWTVAVILSFSKSHKRDLRLSQLGDVCDLECSLIDSNDE